LKSVQKIREEALENTHKNAEKMTERMKAKKRKVQPKLKIGDIVLVSIPEHDQTPMSPKNLPCRILNCPKEGVYELGCAAGVLQVLYRESSLSLETHAIFKELSVIPDTMVSLRTAVCEIYGEHTLDITKCNCKGACLTKQCSCRKAGNECTRSCHKARICKNVDSV
jgi:hypothetical protein